MQKWIVEADIYRLKKAMSGAAQEDQAKIAQHLRRAESTLGAMKQRGIAG